MKLRFLAKNHQHFSCAGVNLSKGETAEFKDEIAQSILNSFKDDFEIVSITRKRSSGKNKMAKKQNEFKQKQA